MGQYAYGFLAILVCRCSGLSGPTGENPTSHHQPVLKKWVDDGASGDDQDTCGGFHVLVLYACICMHICVYIHSDE